MAFSLGTLAVVLLVGWRFTASGQAPANISLDSSVLYQTITGWEGVARAGELDPAYPQFQTEILDRVVNELGINRVRVEVLSGVENPQDYYTQWKDGQIDDATWRCVRYSTVNDNGDANTINPAGFQFSWLDDTMTKVVLPLKQRLEARGEHLFINLEYVAFTNQIRGSGCSSSLQYIHDNPDEYAEVILAATLHLKNTYGVVPDAWEVILEPDNVPEWNGNLIGQAILATAGRLEQNSFTPRFIAPSNTNMNGAINYFNAMANAMGPSNVSKYIEQFSYHRYSGVSTANVQNIASIAATYGINTAMLEHIGSDYQDLHEDLKVGNNSAWEQFSLATPSTSATGVYYRIDTSNPNNPQVILNNLAKFLRQYFLFVRAGAQRIGATTTDSAFDPVAFINQNGNYVVVVKAGSGGSFTVSGLPAGTYGIKYTTNSQYDADLANVTLGSGQLLNASIPASGVITVYNASASFHLCISEGAATGTPTPCPPPQ